MVDHKAIVSAADRFYVVRKIFTASAPIMKMWEGLHADFEIQLSGMGKSNRQRREISGDI